MKATPVVVDTAPLVGCEQYRPLFDKYDWDARIAYAIMRAENRTCDPLRDNTGLNEDGTNDVGIMQINSRHVASGFTTEESRRDPVQSIDTAYRLYKDRMRWDADGWNAWSSYLSGEYLKFK